MKTPCVQICVIALETSLCTGCGRTLGEIASWSGFTDAERDAIMVALPARMTGMALEPDGETREGFRTA
jgi:uncharacterized protein